MNSGDVKEALAKRWPDDQYIRIEEAPQDAARQGRKIDLLVVSLWQSRGYALDVVEIKVSMSDWKRELDNAAKADWWWRHVDRFWVAVPAGIADKVREDLPSTWGLLACTADGAHPVVKAPKHTAEGLSWQTCIGLFRASANAGAAALDRAYQRGRDDGWKQGKKQAEFEGGIGQTGDRLVKLQQQVDEFKAASGVDLTTPWQWADAARLVKAIEDWSHFPDSAVRDLERAAKEYARQGKALGEVAGQVRGLFSGASYTQEETP